MCAKQHLAEQRRLGRLGGGAGARGGVLRTSSAMTEIIVARPVIPAIFAFHSAILGALRYRAAPKLFEAIELERSR